MKNLKKISFLLVLVLVLSTLFSVSVMAAGEESGTVSETASETEAEGGKLDMNLKPESFGERLEYALQGTVTGMLMVFGVLALLTVILYISKYFLYDLPRKESPEERAEKAERARLAKEAEKAQKKSEKAARKADNSAPVQAAPTAQADDGQLAAVITAAIAAMIESGEYKNEFVGGFRVVSFKRSTQSAWNRK